MKNNGQIILSILQFAFATLAVTRVSQRVETSYAKKTAMF
jgi:hypothetical protein